MAANKNLKSILLQKCFDQVEAGLLTAQNQIEDLQESLSSETKSSAGDKHETGRAMIQLEREKAGHRLAEIEKTKAVLTRINVSKSSEIIELGSVVYTNQANYFISVSLGHIEVDNTIFYAISSQTPIGVALMGKQKHNYIEFRERKFKILKVE